jgi:hypothetical protein
VFAHVPDPDLRIENRILSAPAFAEMTLVYSTFGMRQTRFALRHVATCFLIFDLLHFRGKLHDVTRAD